MKMRTRRRIRINPHTLTEEQTQLRALSMLSQSRVRVFAAGISRELENFYGDWEEFLALRDLFDDLGRAVKAAEIADENFYASVRPTREKKEPVQ